MALSRSLPLALAFGAAVACSKTEPSSGAAASGTTASVIATSSAPVVAADAAQVSRCKGTASQVGASAKVVPTHSGLGLEVTLKMPTGVKWTGDETGQRYGVAKITANGANDLVEVLVDGTGSTHFRLPITCAGGEANLDVTVSPPTGPAVAGAIATATATDAY